MGVGTNLVSSVSQVELTSLRNCLPSFAPHIKFVLCKGGQRGGGGGGGDGGGGGCGGAGETGEIVIVGGLLLRGVTVFEQRLALTMLASLYTGRSSNQLGFASWFIRLHSRCIARSYSIPFTSTVNGHICRCSATNKKRKQNN